MVGGGGRGLAGDCTCAGAESAAAATTWLWASGWGGFGKALAGGGVWGFGWSRGLEFLLTGGTGLGGRGFGD